MADFSANEASVRKPAVNIADLEMKASSKGTRFASKAGRIGGRLGMKDLGAQYIVVPPGKSGFPFHSHRNNEEMFIILEGEGTYRFGDETHLVKAGDVCSAIAGDASTAHQLTNTGSGDLRYFAISTRNDRTSLNTPIAASGWLPPASRRAAA